MRFMDFRLLMVVFLIAASPVLAADYDASGTWTFVESNVTDSCGSPVAESGTVVITQNGDNFTIKNGSEIYTGSVSGSTYTASGGDDVASATITFTLSSATSGSGGYDSEWTEFSKTCFGSADLTLTKVQSNDSGDDALNYSGTFKYVTTNVQDSCPDPDLSSETGTIVMKINDDNTFDIKVDDRQIHGTYTGNVFTYTDSFSVNGGTVTEETTVTMTSEDSGTGSTSWTWNNFCGGGHDMTVTRVEESSGGGGGGGGCFIDNIR